MGSMEAMETPTGSATAVLNHIPPGRIELIKVSPSCLLIYIFRV